MICRHLLLAGCGGEGAGEAVRVTPAGRSAAKLAAFAREMERYGAPQPVCFELSDTPALDAALVGVDAVVHCAGPFASTFVPMVEACLRAGAHYIDINGEIAVIEAIASRYSHRAKERGVMLLPAAGFDVVPSDTLCKLLADAFRARHPLAHRIGAGDRREGKPLASESNSGEGRTNGSDVLQLDLFFHFNEEGALISRGTANVMKGGRRGVSITRRGGRLFESPVKAVPVRERQKRAFGPAVGKELTVKPANMADVASAYYSTGIGNIACFMSDVSSMKQLKSVLTHAKVRLEKPSHASQFED